ncbi:MAG: lysophospholipid acyltransferase family protein, partial [Atribacterota bacterium]
MSKGIFLWNIARFSFLPYCKKHYHIHIQGDIPQPPFLIVSNHVSSVDPFLIGPFLPYPVSWVVAQISFQHPIERFFLRKTGAIPKSKSRPDPATVNAIFQIIRQGGIAGLFPEGTITWTGEFQDSLLGSGIERLINNLDVPILGVRIQGAWLSKPVWALRAREGHVFLHFQTFHDPDVLRFIHHSEWDWQKEHLIRYSGKNKALGIERVLWICPQCGGFRTISGNGDHAVCSSCRQTWAIDEYGFIGGCSLPEFIHHQDND